MSVGSARKQAAETTNLVRLNYHNAPGDVIMDSWTFKRIVWARWQQALD